MTLSLCCAQVTLGKNGVETIHGFGVVSEKEKKLIAEMIPDLKSQVRLTCQRAHTHAQGLHVNAHTRTRTRVTKASALPALLRVVLRSVCATRGASRVETCVVGGIATCVTRLCGCLCGLVCVDLLLPHARRAVAPTPRCGVAPNLAPVSALHHFVHCPLRPCVQGGTLTLILWCVCQAAKGVEWAKANAK